MEEKYQKYDEYLQTHINNVKLGFDWLLINMPELFNEFDSDFLGNFIAAHDSSKWDGEEYEAYVNYFYGDSKDDEVEYEFNKAWLHHQHNNPHHWQHWVLREDDGNTIAIEMPKEFVLEMLADWWTFSWRANNLYEIFEWYAKNKDKMVLHPNTKKFVETFLYSLKENLDKKLN